jgi:hypothetical protein
MRAYLESAIGDGYQGRMRGEVHRFIAVVLGVGAQNVLAPGALAGPHDGLVAKHAVANGVPERLVQRVIRIESRGNPRVVHAGNYGLMQIRLGTARGVGYHGDAAGLLDVDTNLTYAVKYLAGAYRAAGCNENRAVSYYQRGYYGASQRECPATSGMEVAQAEVKVAGKFKRESASASAATTEPTDVIKPKVVRTETIATSKSRPAPARPVGTFEPKRVAPSPAQPAEVVKAVLPTVSTPPNPPSTAKADPALTAKTEPPKPAAEQFDVASVPLPPERPGLQASPQEEPERNARRTHWRSGRRVRAIADDPSGVVTFLKKLVTPEKTIVTSERRSHRRRAAKTSANGLARVQPPL